MLHPPPALLPTVSGRRLSRNRGGLEGPGRRGVRHQHETNTSPAAREDQHENNTRGGEVIELEYGITVYPAREDRGRWRAAWYESGERQQCEAATEEKLAARLGKITEWLAADAPNMKRPGADLVAHYLDPDRLPVDKRWSREHTHTQRRLCERFAAPVIEAVAIERSQPGAIMGAYHRVNGEYTGGNKVLLLEVLEDAWGYPGWVMSDWGATPSWEFALKGLDQECGVQGDAVMWGSEQFTGPLKQAYAEGRFPKERLSEMVRRILRSMLRSALTCGRARPKSALTRITRSLWRRHARASCC